MDAFSSKQFLTFIFIEKTLIILRVYFEAKSTGVELNLLHVAAIMTPIVINNITHTKPTSSWTKKVHLWHITLRPPHHIDKQYTFFGRMVSSCMIGFFV